MKTLIQNVQVVSPDVEIVGGSLLLEKDLIVAVFGPGDQLPSADEVIDGDGRIAMPGFFDIHSHGAEGHDISDDSLESVRHIARRKLAEGVTTWLPTTLTLPARELEKILGKCAEYMAAQEFCRVPGVHIEGPFINPKNIGAQNPDYVRLPDFSEVLRLHEIAPVKIVSLAPELQGALEFIKAAQGIHINCSAAHTSATAADLRAAKSAGLTQLTHFGNAVSPLHHREIGVVGFGLADDSLKLELIGDLIHLCPDMLRLVFKLVSIDRLMLITDSTAASWLGDADLQLGGLDVQVRNGAARLFNGTLAGSALRYNDGLKNMVEILDLPLHQLVKATSWNQAQALGLEGFGKLESGYHADIVLLDADFSVWRTLVAGRVVN